MATMPFNPTHNTLNAPRLIAPTYPAPKPKPTKHTKFINVSLEDMAPIASSTLDQETYRPCDICHQPTPIDSPHKACAMCRVMARERERRANDEAVLSARQHLERVDPEDFYPFAARPSAIAPIDSSLGIKNASTSAKNAQNAGILGKRKAGEADHDSETRPVSWKRHKPECTEYQSLSSLRKALSSALKGFRKSTSAHFHGSFSIVADPAVLERARVKLVAADLRTVPDLFRGDAIAEARTIVESTVVCSQVFRCNCGRARTRTAVPPAPPPPQPTPTPTPSPPYTTPTSSQAPSRNGSARPGEPLKRRQSDLSSWIIKAKTKSAMSGGGSPYPHTPTSGHGPSGRESAGVGAGCGGAVHVSAMEDRSHPLGNKFVGQKIVVLVEHPA